MLNSAEQAQLSWAWKKVLNYWYFYIYDQAKKKKTQSFITSGPAV